MKLDDLGAAFILKECKNSIDLCQSCAKLFGMDIPSESCIDWLMQNKDIIDMGIAIVSSESAMFLYLKYENTQESLDKSISFYSKFAGLCYKTKPQLSLWVDNKANQTLKDLSNLCFIKSYSTWNDRTNMDYSESPINDALDCNELIN